MRKTETEYMHFLRDVQEYTMSLATEELGTEDINTIIKVIKISG
jgi:hypothetical protein